MNIKKEGLPEPEEFKDEFKPDKITHESDLIYYGEYSTVKTHGDPNSTGRIQQRLAEQTSRESNGFNNKYAMDKLRKQVEADAEKQDCADRRQRELDRLLEDSY